MRRAATTASFSAAIASRVVPSTSVCSSATFVSTTTRRAEHVGRVVAPAEPGLDAANVDAARGELGEAPPRSAPRTASRRRPRRRDGPVRAPARSRRRSVVEPLGPAADMRRDVRAGRRSCERCGARRRRLAVRADDVDRVGTTLRVAERGEQLAHPLRGRSPPATAQRLQPRDGRRVLAMFKVPEPQPQKMWRCRRVRVSARRLWIRIVTAQLRSRASRPLRRPPCSRDAGAGRRRDLNRRWHRARAGTARASRVPSRRRPPARSRRSARSRASSRRARPRLRRRSRSASTFAVLALRRAVGLHDRVEDPLLVAVELRHDTRAAEHLRVLLDALERTARPTRRPPRATARRSAASHAPAGTTRSPRSRAASPGWSSLSSHSSANVAVAPRVCVAVVETRLDGLEVPVAEVVEREVVELVHRMREVERVEVALDRALRLREAREDPALLQRLQAAPRRSLPRTRSRSAAPRSTACSRACSPSSIAAYEKRTSCVSEFFSSP